MRIIATLAVFILSTAFARVTFPNSEVLQAPDIAKLNYANFHCNHECTAYVDRKSDKLMITQDGNVVAPFDAIFPGNTDAPAGAVLPAGDYKLENRGDPNPEFVFYVVYSTAANYKSPVYAPQKGQGIASKSTSRYVTVLSSFEAIWFSSFTGKFPDSYPRIYGTGFDEAGSGCQPAYQARSQYSAERSWPTIASAVLTIDFGFAGDHNVSINDAKIHNPPKSAEMSTVYTSPGYIGCTFTAGQNYYSPITQVKDAFALTADRLDVAASCSGISASEPVLLAVNSKKISLAGTATYNEHYYKGTFDVSLSWERATPDSSFAIQLDFGTSNDPLPFPTTSELPTTTRSTSEIQTTTSSAGAIMMFSALALLITAYM